MTHTHHRKASMVMVRKVVSLALMIFCFSMAGTNIVGAFADNATETTPTTAVTVYADLEKEILSGNDIALLTFTSVDVKNNALQQVDEATEGTVNNNAKALASLSIKGIKASEVDDLVKIPGLISIEPNRQLTLDSLPSIDTVNGLNPNTGGANPVPVHGKGVNVGIIDNGIDMDNAAFKGADGKSRVVSLGCSESTGATGTVYPPLIPCNKTAGRSAHNQCTSEQAIVTTPQGYKDFIMACYHGTAAAALAAGNTEGPYGVKDASGNTVDVGKTSGVANAANILFYRLAIDASGRGMDTTNLSLALSAFQHEVDLKSAKAPAVLNMSLGLNDTTGYWCNEDNAIKAGIEGLVKSGVTVVASSGNYGEKPGLKAQIAFPACLNGVISVGATEKKNGVEQVTDFSQSVSTLDLLAPGANMTLETSVPGVAFPGTGAGTSFSAPIVAGAVALLKEVKPSLTTAKVNATLRNTGDLITDSANGVSTPRINIQHALDSLATTTVTTTTAVTTTTRAATTTLPGTTIPGTTVPGTTVPSTTAGPSSTVPSTTGGSTTSTPGVTTTAPTTTTTAPPVVNSLNGVTLSIEADLDSEEEFILPVKIYASNTNANAFENTDLTLKVGDNLISSKKVNIPALADDVLVYEGDVPASFFVYVDGDKSKGVAFSRDVTAKVCANVNACASETYTLPGLINSDAIEYSRHYHFSLDEKETFTDTIKNVSGVKITNLKVVDSKLGQLDFPTELAAGEEDSVTMDVPKSDTGDVVFDLKITGALDGVEQTFGEISMTLSLDNGDDDGDNEPIDEPVTTNPVVTVKDNVVTRNAGGETLPFTGTSSTTQLLYAALWILLAGVMILLFTKGFHRKQREVPTA